MGRLPAKFRGFAFGLSVIAGAIMLVVLLPVILPYLAFTQWRDGKRLLALARSFICQRCGKLIGEDAVALGDTFWREHMAELHMHSPAIRFRVVRTVHAVCPHCGAKYQLTDDRMLVPSSCGQPQKERR
jgi:DNA-directed RNA polymerase subunit RPC12/RpoP